MPSKTEGVPMAFDEGYSMITHSLCGNLGAMGEAGRSVVLCQ